MQKLVKRKMHYETIMPVEAYHPEEDPLTEATKFWGVGLLIVSAGAVGSVFGGAPGGVAAAQTVRAIEHHFDLWDTMAEGEVERQNIEQANHDAMHETVVDIGEAIVDGVTTVLDAIDDANGNEPVSSKREGGG